MFLRKNCLFNFLQQHEGFRINLTSETLPVAGQFFHGFHSGIKKAVCVMSDHQTAIFLFIQVQWWHPNKTFHTTCKHFHRGLHLTCVIHVNTTGSHIVHTSKVLDLSKAGLKMAARAAETCSHALLICSTYYCELLLCLT